MRMNSHASETNLMSIASKKNPFRAFWDFFVLFSGISTASNLTRTQPRPVRGRGLFLFRGTRVKPTD